MSGPKPGKNLRNSKCGKCKGTPGQHNVRDAQILVQVSPDGPVKFYPQHGFVFAGGN